MWSVASAAINVCGILANRVRFKSSPSALRSASINCNRAGLIQGHRVEHSFVRTL